MIFFLIAYKIYQGLINITIARSTLTPKKFKYNNIFKYGVGTITAVAKPRLVNFSSYLQIYK